MLLDYKRIKGPNRLMQCVALVWIQILKAKCNKAF